MGIISITTNITGEIGVIPRRVKLVTTDNYATLTAAGYLNSANLMGYTISPIDFIDTVYSYNTTTQSGTNAVFTVTISAGVITLIPEAGSISPTVAAGNIAIYDVNSALTDNVAALNTVTNTSATPGTVRSITGQMTSTVTTMTSGNLVGVRGNVTAVGASGGFIYGVQGKAIPSGTLSGSSWTAGVFGQFDISAATVNAGQTAAIWGDYGTSSGTITSATGMRGVAMTNTTAAVLNAQDYRYGNATYLLELAGAGGTLNYYAAAGTSAGSAGDATHCAAQQVIKIEINGVAAYIPVFTQNT